MQHQRWLPLHLEQKGTAEPPPRMQNQPQPHHPQPIPGMRTPSGLRKTRRGPEQQEETPKQHPPLQEEPLQPTLQRREPERQQQSPHPPAAHAWIASFFSVTASGQRKEGNVNGHENGDGDHVTATGHDELPGERGPQVPTPGLVSVKRPRPVMARVIPIRPVAVRRQQPVTVGKRVGANEAILVAVRRQRPVPPSQAEGDRDEPRLPLA